MSWSNRAPSSSLSRLTSPFAFLDRLEIWKKKINQKKNQSEHKNKNESENIKRNESENKKIIEYENKKKNEFERKKNRETLNSEKKLNTDFEIQVKMKQSSENSMDQTSVQLLSVSSENISSRQFLNLDVDENANAHQLNEHFLNESSLNVMDTPAEVLISKLNSASVGNLSEVEDTFDLKYPQPVDMPSARLHRIGSSQSLNAAAGRHIPRSSPSSKGFKDFFQKSSADSDFPNNFDYEFVPIKWPDAHEVSLPLVLRLVEQLFWSTWIEDNLNEDTKVDKKEVQSNVLNVQVSANISKQLNIVDGKVDANANNVSAVKGVLDSTSVSDQIFVPTSALSQASASMLPKLNHRRSKSDHFDSDNQRDLDSRRSSHRRSCSKIIQNALDDDDGSSEVEDVLKKLQPDHKISKWFEAKEVEKLLTQAKNMLKEQGMILQFVLSNSGNVSMCPVSKASGADSTEFCVVGDLHGQFHDLLTIFKNEGFPFDAKCETFKCSSVLKRHSQGIVASKSMSDLHVIDERSTALPLPSVSHFSPPPLRFSPLIVEEMELKSILEDANSVSGSVSRPILLSPTNAGYVENTKKVFSCAPQEFQSNRRISSYPAARPQLFTRTVLRSYFDVQLEDELEAVEMEEAMDADAKPRARSGSVGRSRVESTYSPGNSKVPSITKIVKSDDHKKQRASDPVQEAISMKKFFPEPVLRSLTTASRWKELGWKNVQYLFNGDLVDRGSWGVEIVITLLAFYILYPNAVFFNRGNHELSTVTHSYGFRKEVLNKYSKSIYASFMGVFARFPLAAVIYPEGVKRDARRIADGRKVRRFANGKGIFVIHGGLFRDEDGRFGLIEDLEDLDRFELDFDSGPLEDAVWSDPQIENGFERNIMRRAGCVFGPDITKAFLDAHGLSLLIRSHEGPDARKKRECFGMPGNMLEGYSVDQTNEQTEPMLVTIFSAPCYPQGVDGYNNKGAYIKIQNGSVDINFVSFDAADTPSLPKYSEEVKRSSSLGSITDKE